MQTKLMEILVGSLICRHRAFFFGHGGSAADARRIFPWGVLPRTLGQLLIDLRTVQAKPSCLNRPLHQNCSPH